MPHRPHPRSRRVVNRYRRILLEQLEDRSLLAATITVNSFLDTDTRDDALTLREAILINNRTLAVGSLSAAEQAQVSGTPTSGDTDTIAFNIPGSGVQTISPTTNLPSITESVVIDGYTQPGASPNTNSLQLGPGALGSNAALRVEISAPATGGDGLKINADNTTVRGLAINGFGIQIRVSDISPLGHSGIVIEGNFLGTNPAGTAAAGASTIGVHFPPNSTNSRVGGTTAAERNVIAGFSLSGVQMEVTSGMVIQGNLIGTDATGTAAIGRGSYGVRFMTTRGDNLVGGTELGAGNLISGSDEGLSTSNGPQGFPGGFDRVQGNFVGTNAMGTASIANRYGVRLTGMAGGLIGGADADDGKLDGVVRARNLISGNEIFGIWVAGSGFTIQGNLIGTDSAGSGPLGNGGSGIDGLTSFSSTLIGGVTALAGNVIAFNGLVRGGDGVRVPEGAGNAIIGNSFFSNAELGIDLRKSILDGPPGVTLNDVGDSDSGSNNLQNYPEINSASLNGNSLSVQYSVPSAIANSAYPLRVEFFKADTDGQEGQTFLGFETYTAAEADSLKTLTFTPAVSLTSGAKIVATATDNAGNTSEFSPGVTLACGTTVNNTNDTGAGSLRSAILCANSLPGTNTIRFSIPGGGVRTIQPLSDLPLITDPVVIDGYTQPGASANTLAAGNDATLLIELDGSRVAFGSGIGLHFGGANGSVVQGLVINRFTTGIEFSDTKATTGVTIAGNFIGTDATGSVARPNNFGIRLRPLGTANTIGGTTPAARNLISGNVFDGLMLLSGGNTVQGNFFGTDKTGTVALRNSSHNVHIGFGVLEGAANNLIGGAQPGAGNVLAAAGDAAIFVVGTGSMGNIIQGNLIGTDVTGTQPLGTGAHGIFLFTNSANNVIGGTESGAGNVIAATYAGPGISLIGSTANLIQGNYIGTDRTGSVDLGNGGGQQAGGIFVGNTGNTIGGTAPGAGNTIAFNRGPGVVVSDTGLLMTTTILSNSFYSNTGTAGIDLGDDGVTPNDVAPPADADSGPNNLQNHPVIDFARLGDGVLTIGYTVPTAAQNATFPLLVEFYRADAEGKEGQTLLGVESYTAQDIGTLRTVTLTDSTPVTLGDGIIATATDAAGNTSEFGRPTTITSAANDPPGGTDNVITLAEDAPYVLTTADFGFHDPADQPPDGFAAVWITTLPANGELLRGVVPLVVGDGVALSELQVGLMRFVPAANVFGEGLTQFTFQVQDDGATANGGIDLDPSPNTITINVSPVNDAPVAVNDAYETAEDSPLIIPAPGVLTNDTDIDSTTLTASIVSLPAHGILTLEPSGSFRYVPSPNYSGPDSFTYRSSDGLATSEVATVSLTVTPFNDPPLVMLNPIGPPFEGTALVVAGGFGDPDTGDTWTATIDLGDGRGELPLAVGVNRQFVHIHSYPDNGTFTITVRVRDAAGAVGSSIQTVSVANVAPQSLVLNGPATIPRGQQVVFAGSFTDPGLADTFSGQIDWGDGQTTPLVLGQGSLIQQFSAAHTFAQAGVYEVIVRVQDDDGGVTTRSAVINVTSKAGTSLRDGVLELAGSPGADNIALTLSGKRIIVNATYGQVNDNQSFALASVQRIVAHLYGGNDTMEVDAKIQTQLFVDAGPGNDKITAGGGPAVLLGGPGNDLLYGGSSRDVLIGASGRDQLWGFGASDLLIGGYTSYDDNAAALLAVLTEWKSSRVVATRISNVRNGTGPVLGGSGVFLKPQVTTFDDADVDLFMGGGDSDWFILQSGRDVTKDRGKSERTN